MFLPLVLHIPTTFHPFTSLRSPITWHTGLSRPSVSFTLSNKSGYSLFSFYPRCSQCHQSAFSKPHHKSNEMQKKSNDQYWNLSPTALFDFKAWHGQKKKICNTLWVKYTKYCKNMFTLWIKKKEKKTLAWVLDAIQIPETSWRWCGAAGSCPNKTSDTWTQRRSGQTRCCEVAKVSVLRWSPRSRANMSPKCCLFKTVNKKMAQLS